MVRRQKKFVFCCLSCVIMLLVLSYPHIEANAYVRNGWVLSNPGNIKFKIGASVGAYTTVTEIYTKKWQIHCPEIGFTKVASDENIYFVGELNVSNGTYAVCRTTSTGYHAITFYHSFTKATDLERYETIVHEVGHALGLDHCQPEYNDISVMRQKEFNGKAYPLSDDISGIAAIY